MNIKKENTVLEYIFNEQVGYSNGPPRLAEDFLNWFTTKINSVPEEFRKDVNIEIETSQPWDDADGPWLSIQYYRPQTEEEKINEDKDRALEKNTVMSSELEMLAKLKAKYET